MAYGKGAVMNLASGWQKIEVALDKLYDILQEKDRQGFTSDQYVEAYS